MGGKKMVVTFVYDGFQDWYLRIPHSSMDSVYRKYSFYCEYFLKRTHSFQDVLDRRVEVMEMLEKTGKRYKNKYNKGRFKTAALFEEEEKNGLFDKLKSRYP